MTEFDLAAAVRQARDDVGPDPRHIAKAVVDLVPESLLRTVLERLLVEYARNHKPTLTGNLRVVGAPRETVRAGHRVVRSGRVPNASAKVAAQQRYARLFRTTVCVTANVWKHFGDCSHDDLMAAAEIRRDNAARSNAAADDFERWAAAVKEHRVKTVRQLPAHVLDDLTAKAAA